MMVKDVEILSVEENLSAIFFDFDGTLINTLPSYLRAYDEALQKIGFKVETKKIASLCFGKKELDVCTGLGVPEKTEAFRETYFLAVKRYARTAPLFDDVISTFEFLKLKDIKIAVLTYAYRWYIDMMIKEKGLDKYVDHVVSQDDVKNPKPDPEAVVKACSYFNIKESEAVIIGDSKSDILMGKSAGSKTALFHRKDYDIFYSLDDLMKAKPDYVISSLSELKEIFFK